MASRGVPSVVALEIATARRSTKDTCGGPRVSRLLREGGKPMAADTYKIVRSYFRGGKRTIARGLTLQEAQAHCRDPETSSKTAKPHLTS
jgi:hypothetical protein